MGGWAGYFRAPELFLMLGGQLAETGALCGKEREGVSRASVGKAAFLPKPHTSNRQFRSSSGLLQGRPTGKGGRPPGTMGAPSTAGTTPGSLSGGAGDAGRESNGDFAEGGRRRIPWKRLKS